MCSYGNKRGHDFDTTPRDDDFDETLVSSQKTVSLKKSVLGGALCTFFFRVFCEATQKREKKTTF